jgi:hypothetical protein
MKFTKETFQKKYKPGKTKELEEDVIGGGGDAVITHNQVSTKTLPNPGIPNSGYLKGKNQTLDDLIDKTRNRTATFGLGGEMGVPYGGRPGNQYVDGGDAMELDVNDTTISSEDEEENTDEITESSKDKMRKMVKELMNSRNQDNEILGDSDDITLKSRISELLKSLKGKSSDEFELVIDLIRKGFEEENNKPKF